MTASGGFSFCPHDNYYYDGVSGAIKSRLGKEHSSGDYDVMSKGYPACKWITGRQRSKPGMHTGPREST